MPPPDKVALYSKGAASLVLPGFGLTQYPVMPNLSSVTRWGSVQRLHPPLITVVFLL